MTNSYWLQQQENHDDDQDHKIIKIRRVMVSNDYLQQWKDHNNHYN
jgi:hypothetical protein